MPTFAPKRYPTLSPRMAAIITMSKRSQILKNPNAETTPAVKRSDAPGRKKPKKRPVSVKMMAKMPG